MKTKMIVVEEDNSTNFETALNLVNDRHMIFATQTHVTWNDQTRRMLYTAVLFEKVSE